MADMAHVLNRKLLDELPISKNIELDPKTTTTRSGLSINNKMQKLWQQSWQRKKQGRNFGTLEFKQTDSYLSERECAQLLEGIEEYVRTG